MLQKNRFKVSIQTFTHLEQNNHIYKILKNHPEGLTIKELTFLAGLSDFNCVKKILNRLKNKVWIRQLGHYKLVYTKVHTKKIRRKNE